MQGVTSRIIPGTSDCIGLQFFTRSSAFGHSPRASPGAAGAGAGRGAACQRRSASITANISPEYSLGEALKFMDETAVKVLPPGYATELNGVSREFRASSGALGLVFVLARSITGPLRQAGEERPDWRLELADQLTWAGELNAAVDEYRRVIATGRGDLMTKAQTGLGRALAAAAP